MKLSRFINDSTLSMKFSDIVKKYDTDNNGLTKEEFKNAVTGMTNKFASGVIKVTRFDKVYFKKINTNNDEKISYEELGAFIKEEYGLDFDSFYSMTVKEICDAISKKDEEKEKAASNNVLGFNLFG